MQYSAGGGTILLKKVKLPDYVKNRTVFAEVVQYSDGDAYDCTGSIFLIPEGKRQSFRDAIRDLKKVPSFRPEDTDYHGLISTVEYDVPLELMRFFIGFGVRKFNYNKVKAGLGGFRTLQDGGGPTGRKVGRGSEGGSNSYWCISSTLIY